jgi:hypothetical protein
MFQTKVAEKIKTQILCSETFFFSKIVPFLDNVDKYGTATEANDDNTIWRMRSDCWVRKDTDTHSECVILIAFPLQQQCFHEGAAMLHCSLCCAD